MGGYFMYKLPFLPYLFQDLEPFIDTHTMGLHYHKHEQNYLNNLNKILEKNKYDYRYNINEILYHLDEFSRDDYNDLLFNLGGVLNHNLYWKSMNKPMVRKLPSNKLKDKMLNTFGDFNDFYKLFKEKALSLKGSGYTFLVVDKNKDLLIVNTQNHHAPLLDGYLPLLNIDLWEHAYYINYENDKSRYIDNYKEIIDFDYANQVYEKIMKN